MKLLIYLGKDFIMDEILNMNINEMANVSFHCSCGKTHHLDIRKIIIGSNVISDTIAPATVAEKIIGFGTLTICIVATVLGKIYL